jgi:gamma-glutamylcyclotransferase (GGCT)/AIG2-like uncharacterized protein YtfP
LSALFAYGTLLFPEVLRAVTGRSFASRPARLEGYARRRFRREVFPGLAPAPGAHTPGRVYLGVDAGSLARLDDFEGARYARRPVRVRTADGAALSAFAYVVRPQHLAALEDAPWDEEQFARGGERARFLARIRGARAGGGLSSAG